MEFLTKNLKNRAHLTVSNTDEMRRPRKIHQPIHTKEKSDIIEM